MMQQAPTLTPIGTGDGSGGVDDLSEVTLAHFTATPAHIGPFDHSLLSWHINGAGPRVRILLGTTQVAAIGQAIVQPAAATGYTLTAASGQARKPLGLATVFVDTSTCHEAELLNLLSLLREQIVVAVSNRPGNYWTGNTNDSNTLSVTLTQDVPPRVAIRALFRQRIPWFPDPWVTLELSFGLAIVNGKFIAVAPSSSGTVEFDKLTWLLGGILLGLALSINEANERATQAGFQVIDGLLTYINVVSLHPDPGEMAKTAVVEHRDGRPFVGYIECSIGSQGPTMVLSDAAETAVLE